MSATEAIPARPMRRTSDASVSVLVCPSRSSVSDAGCTTIGSAPGAGGAPGDAAGAPSPAGAWPPPPSLARPSRLSVPLSVPLSPPPGSGVAADPPSDGAADPPVTGAGPGAAGAGLGTPVAVAAASPGGGAGAAGGAVAPSSPSPGAERGVAPELGGATPLEVGEGMASPATITTGPAIVAGGPWAAFARKEVDHAPLGRRVLADHQPAAGDPLSRVIGTLRPATLTPTAAAGNDPS